MIVCYALGGGLGHITRTRALLHTLGLAGEPVTVLISSPQALDPRALGGWSALLAPPEATTSREALGDWVADVLARLRPRALYVDAFPGGILGDLCTRNARHACNAWKWPAGMQLFHAARRLRWQQYRRRLAGELPPYVRTYVLEPLEVEHHAALAECSADLEELDLQDPPAPLASPGPTAGDAASWLVVHSGPAAEIHQLLAFAADLRRQEASAEALVLIAPARPLDLPAAAHLDVYPAWPLFATAHRIITACGFNAMRQTASDQCRHHFLPFPRTLDDQFDRAARRRRFQQARATGA